METHIGAKFKKILLFLNQMKFKKFSVNSSISFVSKNCICHWLVVWGRSSMPLDKFLCANPILEPRDKLIIPVMWKSLKWKQNGSLCFLNSIAKSYEEPLPIRNVCVVKWNVTLSITADFLKQMLSSDALSFSSETRIHEEILWYLVTTLCPANMRFLCSFQESHPTRLLQSKLQHRYYFVESHRDVPFRHNRFHSVQKFQRQKHVQLELLLFCWHQGPLTATWDYQWRQQRVNPTWPLISPDLFILRFVAPSR